MNEFFLTLQRASLFGVAALFVALLLQWILAHRVPARWRVWVWRVALIQTALALVPLSPIVLAILPARAPVAAPKISESAPAPQAPIIADAPAVAASPGAIIAPAELSPPAVASAPATPARYALDLKLSPREFAVWIYLFGVALQIALLLRNIVRVRRALNACAPLDSAPLRPIAARLKIRRLPRLLQSQNGSPFLVGIARPTIVVPQTLNPMHLEAVFAHELAHHKRRDLTWNALLWALQTAVWFHPLSWLSRRYHALEVESACDELTLQLTQIAPKSYGALLIGAESQQPSPLTAGVNDHFFALKTRLSRLGRAPMQPRRRTAWLLGVALLISFAAVVPFRLTARAQNETKPASKFANVAGTVRDAKGKPLAGVVITAMEPMSRSKVLETVVSDDQGKFRFSDKVDSWTQLFADAGTRGLGTLNIYSRGTQSNPQNIEIAPASRLKLRFIGLKNQPVAGLKVRLWRIGRTPSFKSVVTLPPQMMRAMQVETNASGDAVFGPLPAGLIAKFRIDNLDESFGGQKFAQLVYNDQVHLDKPQVTQGIVLSPPVSVAGRVRLPGGGVAAGVTVSASRFPDGQVTGITDDANDDGYFRTAVTDAQGNYRVSGLHSGVYKIGAVAAATTPGVTRFARDKKISLYDALSRTDLIFARGGLVQGVVISQNTKQPVRGQTLILDSDGDREAVITDARGYFRFRPYAGAATLTVHANGSNSPPPGYVLPAKSKFDFTIKDGEKREFKIELPGKPRSKPTSGIVVGPDGRGVAGASVVYRDIARGIGDLNKSVATDAGGHFALSDKDSDGIVQLFADKADATTPYSTIASPGQTVQLQLAPNAWSSIEGRVTDENKRPLEGIKVELTHWYSRTGISGDKTYTDKNGQFRYARVRPNTSAWVRSAKIGYSEDNNTNMTPLQTGQTRRVNLTMRRASKTLAGTVYGADGKPARGYSVMATGLNSAVATDNKGRFRMSQVIAGVISGWVYGPKQPGANQWPFSATGGDQNVTIRLANISRDTRSQRFNQMFTSAVKPESLIGKAAPKLRVTQWSNGRALRLNQLRDKPVFLVLRPFDGNDNEIRDVARSFGERIHFIGVQLKLEGAMSPIFDISPDEAARKMGFPFAVDALIPAKKALGWQTFASYGSAEYAVIGRDGRVIYAGRQLDRAIELATAAN